MRVRKSWRETLLPEPSEPAPQAPPVPETGEGQGTRKSKRKKRRVNDDDGSRKGKKTTKVYPEVIGDVLNPEYLNQKRYLVLALIAQGGFSKVWKCRDAVTKNVVAIKVHHISDSWPEEAMNCYVHQTYQENVILNSLIHPNIITFHHAFNIDCNNVGTVMEYCPSDTLFVKINRHGRLQEADAKRIMLQILDALVYLSLNEPSVIHCDLKPENILFDSNDRVKIADFGLAFILPHGHKLQIGSHTGGSYWYLPPECFVFPSWISTKVDVWSLGVIFYVMLYGKFPIGHNLTAEEFIAQQVMQHPVDIVFDDAGVTVSHDAKGFIETCMAWNQDDRPRAEALSFDTYVNSDCALVE